MRAGKGQEAVGSRCLVMPGTWIWRGRQGILRACPLAAARRAHHPAPMWPQHRPGDGALATLHTCSTLRAPGGLVSEPQATDPFHAHHSRGAALCASSQSLSRKPAENALQRTCCGICLDCLALPPKPVRQICRRPRATLLSRMLTVMFSNSMLESAHWDCWTSGISMSAWCSRPIFADDSPSLDQSCQDLTASHNCHNLSCHSG